MPAFVGAGDRIVLPSGRISSLKRPSYAWDASGVPRHGTLTDGRTLSFRQIAIEQPWISVAVNGKARQIARLPWKVFRSSESDRRGRVRDRDSDAARRLARPGLRRSATELKYAIACGLLIDGNHVEEKVTLADGSPGLRALDWRWLVPFILDNEVIGWEYRPPDSEPRAIDIDDVIHYRWQGYRDAGPLGTSSLEHLGVTIRNEDAAQKWGEANFRNGTRIGIAVLMDKDVKASPTERTALSQEVNAKYVGMHNVGRPIVLGGGVSDVKAIGGQSPVEAALIDQRYVNREEILAVFDWPAPLGGDLRHATYSNVAELARILFTIVLPPWTGLMAEQTTAQLIGGPDPSKHYTMFDFNDALRGDLTKRMAAYKTAVTSGLMTLNRVQELEDEPLFDHPLADQPLVPGNNLVPLDQLVAKAAEATGIAKPEDPDPDQGGRPETDPADEPAESTTE